MIIRCPHCNFAGKIEDFKIIKSWKFRFYDVKMLECPRCGGIFNYYSGVSPKKGTLSVFYIKIKPRNVKKKR